MDSAPRREALNTARVHVLGIKEFHTSQYDVKSASQYNRVESCHVIYTSTVGCQFINISLCSVISKASKC